MGNFQSKPYAVLIISNNLAHHVSGTITLANKAVPTRINNTLTSGTKVTSDSINYINSKPAENGYPTKI